MKTLHVLLSLVQVVIALVSPEKHRLTPLRYWLGFDSAPQNAGSRHAGNGPQSPSKHIEIDADLVHHE